MKLNLTGMLFELEQVNFRVGAILQITFSVEGSPFVERVRTIKHYDRYFRTPPKKATADEPAQQPKRLVELHFVQLREDNRKVLLKQLMTMTLDEMKKQR